MVTLGIGTVFGLFSAVMLASTLRGYAVTVTYESIELHRLWTSNVRFEDLRSVEVIQVERNVGLRECLRFHLTDGTDRVFKDFNGSLKPSTDSYQIFHAAKDLIDERMRQAGN